MMLTRLRLRNVKSYVDETIEFMPGINSISGENGHGKTTILEAIGYALFDHLPYPERDFLRRGTKSGSVELEFVGDDEIPYTLKRKVGGSDISLHTPLGKITGKKDVQDWLIDNLFPHVRDARELRSIFENTLGVPQGSFTTAFAQTPSARKSVFDTILGVDEYKNAYTELRTTVNTVEEHINQLEKQKIELETRTENFDELKREKTELQTQTTRLSEDMEKTQKRLEELDSRKKELETVREQLQELEKRLQTLRASRDVAIQQLSRIQREIEQAEAAEKKALELEEKHREYEESEQTLRQLYARREQRSKDSQTINNLKSRLEVLQEREQRKRELEQQITQLSREKEQLLPLAEKQERVEREIETIERELKEPLQRLIYEKRVLQREQERAEELKERIKTLQGEIEQLQPRAKTQERLTTEIKEKEQDIKVVQSEIAELERKKAQTGRTNQCPLLEGIHCTFVKDFETYFTEEIKRRQKTLSSLQTQMHKLESEVEALGNPGEKITQNTALITSAQQELEKLTHLREKTNEITEQFKSLSRRFQQYLPETLKGEEEEQEQIEQLLSRLRSEVDSLDDARAKLKTREERLHEVQSELEQLSDIPGQINTLQQELQEQENFQKKYAGLDETITVIEGKIEKLKEAHESYLQNRALARKKPDLTREHSAFTQQLQGLQMQISEVETEQSRLKTGFNEAELQRITGEVLEENRKLSGQQSALKEKKQQLQRLQEELAQMETNLRELATIRKKLKDARGIHSYVSFIRDLLNNSGQLIVLEMINQIARDATDIYCELMNDHSLELHWSEDYNIIITENGEERHFTQLSGGEQMSAALAVRLSLLKTISKSDIVFLDEPTTNMDAQRRENLAHQIQHIHGFKQIFIISHDDTFNEQSDHTIHVEKTRGESHINTCNT